MSDLSGMIGKTGVFARDARFLPAEPAQLAPGLAAFARPLHAPAPRAPEPLPDPLALAHAEGFAQGLAAARADAEAQARTDDEARERFTFAFSRLDAELTEKLRQRLLDTVVALCEATLQPLALDRDLLAARVAKAAGMFVRADDERVIRLHPEDLALVRPLLPPDWVYAPDPSLLRGAIRVEAQGGGAEDGPETWRRAIAEALDLC